MRLAQYSKNVVKNAVEREVIISISLLSTLGNAAVCSHPSLPQGHIQHIQLTCVSLLVHQNPQGFFSKAASFPVSPHSRYSCRVILCRLQDFRLVILSFRRLLTDHSSSILTIYLVPLTTLLRAFSVPLFRWFMKTSSSVGPVASPSDTARNWPLVGLYHWPPSFESRILSIFHPQWSFF